MSRLLLLGTGGHGAAFSPNQIDGLELWLDASDSSTLWQDTGGTTPAGGGDVVGKWDDKSGSGNHLVANGSIGHTLELNQQNGLPGVVFSTAVAGRLQKSSFNLVQPWSVVAVVRQTTAKGKSWFGDGNINNSVVSANDDVDHGAGVLLEGGSTVLDTTYLVGLLADGASSGISLGGVNVATGDAGTAQISTFGMPRTSDWGGVVCELIGAPGDWITHSGLISYLTAKWSP